MKLERRKMGCWLVVASALVSDAAAQFSGFVRPLDWPPYNDKTGNGYSTVYRGNYSDGGEGLGSHPGVDIIADRQGAAVTTQTKIIAIYDGVVVRRTIDGQNDHGWGNCVVVKHTGVPDAGPSQTIYSCYAHLSSVAANPRTGGSWNANDQVAKGDPLGFVGETGAATGVHLHFQIDQDFIDYPVHPYWPQRNNGLSPDQQVAVPDTDNLVLLHTYDPIPFVESHLAPSRMTFSVTDLGDLPGGDDFSIAWAINDNGQVVGSSYTSAGNHPFLWDVTQNPAMKDVGVLSGTVLGEALSIDKAGLVVGYCQESGGPDHAFLYDGSQINALPVSLPSVFSYAHCINNVGQVGGTYENSQAQIRGFITDGQTVTEIGTLGGSQSSVYALNDSGTTVGSSDADNGFLHPFVCIFKGNPIDLLKDVSLPGDATGINLPGQVVGRAGARAALWTTDGVLDPNFDAAVLQINPRQSHAQGINNQGVVVGYYAPSGGGDNNAFIWMSGYATLQDLNTLMDASGSDWHLYEATAVNNLGQIVGIGLHNGLVHAFLLNPN